MELEENKRKFDQATSNKATTDKKKPEEKGKKKGLDVSEKYKDMVGLLI